MINKQNTIGDNTRSEDTASMHSDRDDSSEGDARSEVEVESPLLSVIYVNFKIHTSSCSSSPGMTSIKFSRLNRIPILYPTLALAHIKPVRLDSFSHHG